MHIINAFKGIFIGIALVVPGLSGSIIALVMGLYDDIINAVSGFRKDIKGNIKFLAPIGIGAVAGILASARAVLWLCQTYPLQAYLFFTGLVLGAYPLIFRKMTKSKFKPSYIIAVALGFSFMFIISFIMDTGADSAYIAIDTLDSASDFGILLAVGAVSMSFMMIPGVSGAVMLMVMGQYGTVYNAVGMSIDLIGYILRGNFEAAAEVFMTVMLVLPFAFHLWIKDNGQIILKTYPVRQPPDCPRRAYKVTKFMCTIQRGRVIIYVGMNMLAVNMGGDKKCVFPFRPAHGKVVAYFQGGFCVNLAGLKGLPHLIA